MLHISHFLLLFLLISSNRATSNAEEDDGSERNQHNERFISLGAIVDYNSRAGKEEKVAMKIAVDDFFGHGGHRPTVLLRVKNSRGDPLQTAYSAKTLIKKHHARVILGLGTWQETAIVAELANKSKVPLLSLANEVPSQACSHWPFLVNAARSQFAQMKAIAAIIQSWGWRKVNVIYEDTITNPSLTAGITPYLIKALQEVGFRVEFRRQFPKETNPKPGIHSLQAYDAVRAVALAMSGNYNRKFHSALLSTGQNLLKGILNSNFEGLTGPFIFKQGMLAPAQVFRIVNVVGDETCIDVGYWTEELGFSVNISRDSVYNKSMKFLGQVLWPGRPLSVPGGLEEAKRSTSSQSQASLKIGVPTGNNHVEFVNVRNNSDGSLNVTGFVIEVFNATIKLLRDFPPYEFVEVSGTYDSLVDQLNLQVE
ncbi:hypothetical protein LWI29_029113 [Acer saccharum]|uniref:Receptor ligand binding region domain-containing protein n=1 Tax=Acer saccharum TaxID=4024 RepID=A0AA39SI44_ACESA|nr:hypothetical protein LWI29_029113 [Acer saccharum]